MERRARRGGRGDDMSSLDADGSRMGEIDERWTLQIPPTAPARHPSRRAEVKRRRPLRAKAAPVTRPPCLRPQTSRARFPACQFARLALSGIPCFFPAALLMFGPQWVYPYSTVRELHTRPCSHAMPTRESAKNRGT